ncbi:MAG: hypothetical protein KC656_07840, partial [Myxococcales bacterium]|nr:hypothetical protein [Myxococcales bacterium]
MWHVVLHQTAWAAPTVVELPVAGRQQTEVAVPRFGRMAFEVVSEQGASLQLVDRMAGPGATDGVVGQEDGRIDVFSDVGQVRVITRGPVGAEGSLRVVATPFERLGSSPLLEHRKAGRAELRDKTERAWWVDHDGARELHLEAIGRYVGDLRLWRDGTWLVDATPRCSTWTPVSGQPLQRCTLTVRTEPGLYQLVAYGGPGEPWANDEVDTSLTVRWDLPARAGNGRITGRLDATGRYLLELDREIDVAHVALDEHAPIDLHFQDLGSAPFELGSPEATITDTSRLPIATASRTGSSPRVVGVTGPPGQRFTLTWFDQRSWIPVSAGPLLLTSLSTGRWNDDFPPTAAVVHTRSDGRVERVGEVAVEVGSGEVFRKRFNLLEPVRFLLRVPTTATHALRLTEGQGTVLVEPFFVSPPERYKAPPARPGAWEEELGAGLYRVTLTPTNAGIATLEVTRNDWSDVAQRQVSTSREVSLLPELRLALDLPPIKDTYRAYVFDGEARTGLNPVSTPLDLRATHALALGPGESWTTGVSAPDPVRVQALYPDGEPMDIELLGRRDSALDVQRGSWALTLHNTRKVPVVVGLGPVPETAPARPLPPGRLTALPDFPTLTNGQPYFMDLGRTEQRTLKLEVARDGLYHLQSTGLLATSGSLRNRVTTGLGDGSENGVGRNFRIARFLLSGEYQVTVGARGRTAGHLGVELADVPMVDGGKLGLDEEARVTLPAETGVVYRFDVPTTSDVRIRSASPERAYPCRLEDPDGWPVVAPTERCDTSVRLEPGSYVLRSLPDPVLTKRTTSLTTSPLPEPLQGHGPFALALGTRVEKTWVEPVGDGDRPEDVFTLAMPAKADVTVSPSTEMKGEVRQGGKVVGRIVPGRAWTGPLERGEATVAVQTARRGTGIPYALTARSDVLLVGQDRRVSLPTTLPIRVGEDGLVTLRSDGLADARARLIDASGALVAANDDRPDGWDFQIAQWLEAGDYTLQVDRVGNRRDTR